MIGYNIAHIPLSYRHPRDVIFTNSNEQMPCVTTFAQWHF